MQHGSVLDVDGTSKLPASLARLGQEYDVKIKLAKAKTDLVGCQNNPGLRPKGGSAQAGSNQTRILRRQTKSQKNCSTVCLVRSQ